MYSKVNTAIVHGIDSCPIHVECDISSGMPMFSMVGFLASEVKESKDRIRIALRNCGYELPVKKITINFSPANIKKSGAGFDLSVAIGILSALEIIPKDVLPLMFCVGELSLEGDVLGIPGVLSMVICAKESGLKTCIVPKENEKEARLIPGIEIIGVTHLQEAIHYLLTGEVISQVEASDEAFDVVEHVCDFSEIRGQKVLKRACEIAISGMHNFLMVGPPGAGKTMIAKCIPTILPTMSVEEQIELSKIYSVCGLFSQREHLMEHRPFRSPHHTISEQGLTGGGVDPKPGEISLAHSGILFLDELTEFKKSTLEVLRQPLEEKRVTISRVGGTYTYPANFVLVGAMNPCNCGYYPDFSRCHCSPAMIQRYRAKLSQPLLDRMDLCVEVSAVTYQELTEEESIEEDSATIRRRVEAMHRLQKERFAGSGISFNSQIPAKELSHYCRLSPEELFYMEMMFQKMQLTARTYHKVLRVARTIADMDGSVEILRRHLQEAILFRGMDQTQEVGI